MAHNRQAVRMEILIVLTILVLAGVYSVVRRETRDYDDRDRQGWWPGAPRG